MSVPEAAMLYTPLSTQTSPGKATYPISALCQTGGIVEEQEEVGSGFKP